MSSSAKTEIESPASPDSPPSSMPQLPLGIQPNLLIRLVRRDTNWNFKNMSGNNHAAGRDSDSPPPPSPLSESDWYTDTEPQKPMDSGDQHLARSSPPLPMPLPGTDSPAESEAEIKKSEADDEAGAESESKSEVQSEADYEVTSEADDESEAESESESEVQSEADYEVESEAEVQPDIEDEDEVELEDEAETGAQEMDAHEDTDFGSDAQELDDLKEAKGPESKACEMDDSPDDRDSGSDAGEDKQFESESDFLRFQELVKRELGIDDLDACEPRTIIDFERITKEKWESSGRPGKAGVQAATSDTRPQNPGTKVHTKRLLCCKMRGCLRTTNCSRFRLSVKIRGPKLVGRTRTMNS